MKSFGKFMLGVAVGAAAATLLKTDREKLVAALEKAKNMLSDAVMPEAQSDEQVASDVEPSSQE